MIELLDDDPGMMRLDAPGLRKTQKQLLGTRERGGDVILPACSWNVLRLIDFFGEDAVLDDAPDELWALATQPWGFEPIGGELDHWAWDTLYHFQHEAVEYLISNPHGAALLALSPGLGKSAVATIAADVLEHDRVLVLAPVSLTFNWSREIEKWSNRERDVWLATAKDREPGPTGVTVTNHEVIQEVVLRDEDGNTLTEIELGDDENGEPVIAKASNAREVKAWIEAGPMKQDPKSGKAKPARERITRVRRDYRDAGWDLIVVDESILLKNRRAKKTDVLASLCKANPGADVWMLSGSPTAKYRDDLFRQLQIMSPRAFSSYWRFAEFFCVVEKGPWGWKILGDRPDVDVHHYLRDYIFVRSQDDVLAELPDYVYRDIDLEATPRQRKALDSMFDDWIAELEDAPGEPVVADNFLAQRTRLQQITSNTCALPKDADTFHTPSSAKEDLLIDLIEQGDIEMPLLIWTWYVETTRRLEDVLTHKFKDLAIGSVVGSDSSDDKIGTIEAYKGGELDVLILQMGVGKFGHTLTDTRTVFYHDRSFDSDAWVQSLKRVRRIGLEHRPVLIVPRIVASADQLIDGNLDGKLRSVADMTNAELAGLLARARVE